MKYLIKKLNIKLYFFLKKEFYYIILKSFFFNLNICMNNRCNILFKKWKKFRSGVSLFRMRCLLTNRSKAIFHFFFISRIMVKKKGSFSKITGFRKSCW